MSWFAIEINFELPEGIVNEILRILEYWQARAVSVDITYHKFPPTTLMPTTTRTPMPFGSSLINLRCSRANFDVKLHYSLLACSTPHCLLLQTITSQCCKVSVTLRLSENEFEKCGVRKNFVTTKWMDSYQANRFQDNAKGNRLDIATGREFFQLA